LVTNNAPASFAVGTNWVTWTVVDTSGNTAGCVQTVTIAPVLPGGLAIFCSGGLITLIWDTGILQEADSVAGEFSDVAGAISPYTIAMGDSAPEKYFRLRLCGP